MQFQLAYARHARADLEMLDSAVRNRVLLKLESIVATASPMRSAKVLKGIYVGLYRFRVGDYRVIFRKEDNGTLCILLILRVRHRKEVYE